MLKIIKKIIRKIRKIFTAKETKIEKRYLDDMPLSEAMKYISLGMVAVTGNGHLYGFAFPEHTRKVEDMRVAYDALEG